MSILPMILLSGFLDSFNPCAIAVLLLFIGLMFTMGRERKAILGLGLLYIASVFITYLAIGLGLFNAIHFFNIPHLVTKIGAALVVLVGLWGLKEYFFPGKFILLAIPIKSRQMIAGWASKMSAPAVVVAGFLVGLTEFPCTGAIYVAALSLLYSSTTYLTGVLYLVLYNLMFILPLLAILVLSTNRLITEKLIDFNESRAKKVRLLSALIMIAIGLVIFIWFS